MKKMMLNIAPGYAPSSGRRPGIDKKSGARRLGGDMMKKWILYIVITIMALLSLFPFYILLFVAFSPSNVSMSDGNFLLKHIEWGNLSRAWQQSNMGGALVNSLLISAGSVVVIVFASAGAGYVFARVETWYNKLIFNLILFSMFIPGIINTVPLYSLMRKIGGIDTHWGLILLIATGSLPFSIFLYINFIKGISKEMEEAAIIDGCTLFGAFWRISFPLLKPITSTVIILSSIGAWNNYGQAVFFLQRQDMQTVPLAISRFVQSYGADYTMLGASALIGLIPVVLVYLFLQRYFIKGISAGSVKG